MDYTPKLLFDFINKLIDFDKKSQLFINSASDAKKNRNTEEQEAWHRSCSSEKQLANSSSHKIYSAVSDLQNQRKPQTSRYTGAEKNSSSLRLAQCKKALVLISSAEKSIARKDIYETNKYEPSQQVSMCVDDIISEKINFISMSHALNNRLADSKTKDIAGSCATFYRTCREAEAMLNQEIVALRNSIAHSKVTCRQSDPHQTNVSYQNIRSSLDSFMSTLTSASKECTKQKKDYTSETDKFFDEIDGQLKENLQGLIDTFHKQFPPQELLNEYSTLYSMEPSFEHYSCCKEIPRNVHISTLRYNISHLRLSNYTKNFLNKYYFFLYREDSLCIPHCASFDAEFNYLFQFNSDTEGRRNVIQNACALGMRLFMMLPPGKLNFTFIDPITLGESFSMFTRLVDTDDRTSEVINGKIWSSPADIEEKLKIMTDHISNVTQRCLQGRYGNIYEYNRVAEQNAEAYQILMLMDFPAGLTEQSLKLLEQIVTSGPKCGVFTIIYQNENQHEKLSGRFLPFITNIASNFQKFIFNDDCTQITYSSEMKEKQSLLWSSLSSPDTMQLDQIIATLKKGIKTADRVVIGIDKVRDAETTSSTKDGIRIPIGIHGANEVQYLTLGVGGSHHALIAGMAGSGKSSLLHTIILRMLTQYSPDELSIYLVDFKRGVEFKIYADFEIPSFKVIAIESEREFGYNILLALEREQKIRADLFKKNNVDKIEEYRALDKKMPRVLVIMDEFHELFSHVNDEFTKKSALIMERIVRQGRAFGIHLILASQSYSNITGVDRAVFDQMAVRVLLRCSPMDANLLLDNGSTEINQISIDDPGRAVYNSEAGNKEYNSHFRVAYIEPEMHRGMLQEISSKTISSANKSTRATRILLSNIEDNKYSIFNQFYNYEPSLCPVPGRLYIGEPLSIANDMNMDLVRSDNSNLLMLGNDTEKARSMFAFAILSLCINYRVRYGRAPERPFIYLLNCKPLDDSYFKDIPKMIACELLPEYVRYIHCGDESAIHEVLSELHDTIKGTIPTGDTDKYFFVFGYQRAEELKSEIKLSQSDDIDSLFNLMPGSSSKPQLSSKELFSLIVKDGAKNGVHAILWQDSYSVLEQDDHNIMSHFSLRVAFDMSPEEFSRSVGANDISLMGENNAIYYNKARDNQRFRPYQTPDEEWLNDISAKLH